MKFLNLNLLARSIVKQGRSLLILSVVSITLVACGGGSSSVKENKILGDVPSLILEMKAKDAEIQEKLKLAEDMDAALELSAKQEKMKAEYSQKIDQAVRNLSGKDVPFEVTENPFYEVVSVKLIEQPDHKGVCKAPYVKAIFKNKEVINLDRFSQNDNNYTIYYKIVDVNGNTLAKGDEYCFRPNLTGKEKVMTIAAGSEMTSDNHPYLLKINHEAWADFDKIVFISKEAYDTAEIYKPVKK